MNPSKLARLAAKLDYETLEGKVHWIAGPPPADLVRGTDDVITTVFETEYNTIGIRVFEKRVKVWIDDVTACWEHNTVIQFLGDRGGANWDATNITGVYQLIDTIKLVTCRVENKIAAILAA